MYAQYYALKEMGYSAEKIKLYSISDNKSYKIDLPTINHEMDCKFRDLIRKMHSFDIGNFEQTNVEKCKKCIYEPSCYRSLLC